MITQAPIIFHGTEEEVRQAVLKIAQAAGARGILNDRPEPPGGDHIHLDLGVGKVKGLRANAISHRNKIYEIVISFIVGFCVFLIWDNFWKR